MKGEIELKNFKIFKMTLICALVVMVIMSAGCAKQMIADRIQGELVKQTEQINPDSMASTITDGILVALTTLLTGLFRRYTNNRDLEELAKRKMLEQEKNIEYFLAGLIRSGKGHLIKEINELDLTKPLGPQLSAEMKELVNKIKLEEVTAFLKEKATGYLGFGPPSEKRIAETIKSIAPTIKSNAPALDTVLTDNLKVIPFRSPEAQNLVEEFRRRVVAREKGEEPKAA